MQERNWFSIARRSSDTSCVPSIQIADGLQHPAGCLYIAIIMPPDLGMRNECCISDIIFEARRGRLGYEEPTIALIAPQRPDFRRGQRCR